MRWLRSLLSDALIALPMISFAATRDSKRSTSQAAHQTGMFCEAVASASRAVMAARSYGPRRIGVAHDTISSSPLGCGARVLPWSGRELNFWQCFVALGNCTGNHGSVSWLPTIKCAGEHYGASNSPPLFTCPNCKALYQCVKIEAGPETADNELRCQVCSGPLVAREGKFVLKYYLLREAIRRERRKWRSGRTKID